MTQNDDLQACLHGIPFSLPRIKKTLNNITQYSINRQDYLLYKLFIEINTNNLEITRQERKPINSSKRFSSLHSDTEIPVTNSLSSSIPKACCEDGCTFYVSSLSCLADENQV